MPIFDGYQNSVWGKKKKICKRIFIMNRMKIAYYRFKDVLKNHQPSIKM